MAHPFAAASSTLSLADVEAFEVHHWPIVRAYAERLGLVELINRLVPCEMAVDPGTIVLGLVIDTLSGRSPLYHLESFFAHQDRALLLGRELEASAFNDDNVGRVLDRLFEAGTQRIFSSLSLKALEQFRMPITHLHHDTTSVSLYGDYRSAEGSPLEITYGHSKDHRPDLKQFIVSLLCTEGNVPLLGTLEDGNASDKTINNELLTHLSAHLARCGIAPKAFVYLADAALVTPANLALLGEQTLFISRLPANYGEHARVIAEAVAADRWVELGRLAQTPATTNRPGAQYKVADLRVPLYDRDYRAVVVHSSSHDRRRQQRLERQVAESLQHAQAACKTLSQLSYACEADAQAAAERARAQRSAYHELDVVVEPRPRYAPGRPRRDGQRTLRRLDYGLKIDVCEAPAAIAQARAQAGCFVLLTNLPASGEHGHSARQVLQAYKEQHSIERNFSFLKDDAIVNALFLKTPQRLEALGLILLIALLIWRLMDYQMRQHLAQTHTQLSGWDNKPTRRPTAYMVVIKFKSTLILKQGGYRRLARPLSEVQQRFLHALGLTEAIFTQAMLRSG